MESESDQVVEQGFNISCEASKTKATIVIECDEGMTLIQLGTLLAELGVKLLKQEAGFQK
jgi:hypothetical protein